MSTKSVYQLNPNCSGVLVGKGNEKFIYFYYRIGNKRKQIKFKDGLNDSNITESQRNQRIRTKYNEIHDLLTYKIFNGKTFEGVQTNESEIPSVKEAIKVYIENRTPYTSPKTILNYKNGLNFFVKFLKNNHSEDIKITDVNALLIEDYVAYMLRYISPKTKQNLSVMTINEYKDRLAFVLNFWHKKKRILPYNVMEEVSTGNALKNQTSLLHKALTIEELRDVFSYVKKHRKPPYLTFLLLIYYTHLRPKEICRLQLKDFDMEKRVINLVASKSKTRIQRIVVLDSPIYNHLLSIGIDFSDAEYQHSYFFSYSSQNRICYVGDKMYRHDNMTYSFNTMMLDLGLENRGFTKYGLKHTANVHEIVYEGMSFAEVQVKNGHTMEKQTQTYLRNLKEFYNNPSPKERILKFDL